MRQITLNVNEEEYQIIKTLAGGINLEQFVLNNLISNTCWIMLDNSFSNLNAITSYLSKKEVDALCYAAYQNNLTLQDYCTKTLRNEARNAHLRFEI